MSGVEDYLTAKELEEIKALDPAVVYICEPEGYFSAIFISGKEGARLGYDPSRFLNDRDFWVNHVHPEDLRAFIKSLPRLFATGGMECRYRILHADSGFRWLRDELTVVRDEDGRLKWVLGYWTEMTELEEASGGPGVSEFSAPEKTDELTAEIMRRERAEVDLRVAKEQAEAANRAKTEFLANVGHELRTPLNAVIGFSESLLHGTVGTLDNEKHREYVEAIYHAGSHLLDLINDILDISALESGRLELVEERVDIEGAIEEVLAIVGPRAESGAVEVVNIADRGVPALTGDARRIRQIILNIVSNAVKFTPPGGRVTIEAGVAENGALRISVADTGIGMDGAGIAEAQSKFGQVDSDLAREFDGSGLGLPLTKELVELHGGRLEIDSAPGRGTTVSAIFPSTRVIGAFEAR